MAPEPPVRRTVPRPARAATATEPAGWPRRDSAWRRLRCFQIIELLLQILDLRLMLLLEVSDLGLVLLLDCRDFGLVLFLDCSDRVLQLPDLITDIRHSLGGGRHRKVAAITATRPALARR